MASGETSRARVGRDRVEPVESGRVGAGSVGAGPVGGGPDGAGSDSRADRVLLMLYGLFAVAASGRSAFQLIVRPADALLAYWLSAVAAGCYLVGLGLVLVVRRQARPVLAMAKGRRTVSRMDCRFWATTWCVVEFVAVLSVGTWTLLAPSHFTVPTVWSYYGVGYLFLPTLLPVGVLVWLRVLSRPGPS